MFCNRPCETSLAGRQAPSRELAGYCSARHGAYRITYRLDGDEGIVHVVRIEHRADIYRPHIPATLILRPLACPRW